MTKFLCLPELLEDPAAERKVEDRAGAVDRPEREQQTSGEQSPGVRRDATDYTNDPDNGNENSLRKRRTQTGNGNGERRMKTANDWSCPAFVDSS